MFPSANTQEVTQRWGGGAAGCPDWRAEGEFPLGAKLQRTLVLSAGGCPNHSASELCLHSTWAAGACWAKLTRL